MSAPLSLICRLNFLLFATLASVACAADSTPVVSYFGKEFQRNAKKFESKFENADLLFIRSTSTQAKALEEITQSRWTHVGILFRVKEKTWELSSQGQWFVLEAGPQVRFHPVDLFINQKEFAVIRLRDLPSGVQTRDELATKVHRAGRAYLNRNYDIYFMLTRDGKTPDQDIYCSELTWYAYGAVGIALGKKVSISEMLKNRGPESNALIEKRFAKPNAPKFEEWKRSEVIPPETQLQSRAFDAVRF